MTGKDRSELGKTLKRLRLAVPLTLQELAIEAHMSASHIGRIERGERFPSARILRRLAKPLHMKEFELMIFAGFLSSETDDPETGSMNLDPYVSSVLSQETVEIQRTVVAILALLKSLAKSLQPGLERG